MAGWQPVVLRGRAFSPVARRALLVRDAGYQRTERIGTGSVIETEVVDWAERTTDRSSQGVHRAHDRDHDLSIRARKGWIKTLSNLGQKQKDGVYGHDGVVEIRKYGFERCNAWVRVSLLHWGLRMCWLGRLRWGRRREDHVTVSPNNGVVTKHGICVASLGVCCCRRRCPRIADLFRVTGVQLE
jgi:hypothetical protein